MTGAGDPRRDAAAAVLFHSEGCPHCVEFRPSFNQVARRIVGVGFYELPVDTDEATAKYYAIEGLPTTLIFKGGVPVSRITGGVAHTELERRIRMVVGG